ncbi:hypothetical protein A33Q_0670 [Indibacter alkaliphilus LW1]|uniref:Uncharacterized protein n=1 Tax=Indibacter alkaliphilus (strain CCUG 57479 / KCTC 22604 / LW1) TaxID=1189612 RepID=S2DK04_INDAL|nr:hypothetical protein A33Q_0670 [Indibacter alkaliphilus LW1]
MAILRLSWLTMAVMTKVKSSWSYGMREIRENYLFKSF